MTRAYKHVASLERIWLTPEVKDEEANVAKRQQRVHKRKRFILVDREHGNVLGDTGFDYRYRTIRRSHPNAVFDAYRAPPGFPRAAEGSPPDTVTRACEYVASLARRHPHCSVCRQPMEPFQLGIDSPGLYGYAVGWNDPHKRCCSRCYVTRVLPARLKAESAF